MPRLEEVYGDGVSSSKLGDDDEKNRGEETEKNSDGVGFIAWPRSKEKPHSSLPMPTRS